MIIKYGYKIYKKGLKNNYDGKHEVGKTYRIEDDLVFQKSGYHYCPYLEDTLRYYDAFNDEVDICVVIGYGKINEYYDDYYDYEIYSTNNLRIIRKLSREEIIAYANKLPDYRLCRFISGFRLTEEEINFLVNNHPSGEIQKYIDYYQLGETDAFRR